MSPPAPSPTPMQPEIATDVAEVAAIVGKARPRTFSARTPLDLMLKVYAYHGWPVTLGRMAARFVEHYDMTTDHRRNRYVATPRAHLERNPDAE